MENNNTSWINVDFSNKQNHWFVRFYKWSVCTHSTPTKNGCEFAWNSLFSILFLPLTVISLVFDLIVGYADNLFGRIMRGACSLAFWLILMIIGFSLFVGGEHPDTGKPFWSLVTLVVYENGNNFWILIILPIATLIFGSIIVIAIVVLIGLVLLLGEFILEYKVKLQKYKFIPQRKKMEVKKSFFFNFFKIIVAIKNNICPIIKWE